MLPANQKHPLIKQVSSSLRMHLRIPLFANAYALMTNQVVAAGLGFLYWLLAARLYADNVVGVNSAAISTILFAAYLAELSFKSAMMRFVPRAGRNTPRLIGATFGINLSLAFLVSLFLVTVGRHIPLAASLLESVKLAPGWFILATMVWSISYIQDGVLIGMGRSKWVLAKNLLVNGSKLILLVVFCRVFPEYGLVASWFVAMPILVLVFGAMIFFQFMPKHLAQDFSQTKAITRNELIRSISGDYVGGLLAETSTRLLPLLVLYMLGESFTAYYYQAWNVASALFLLATSMISAFTAEASANMVQLALHSRRILRQMATLLIPAVLVIWLAVPLILTLFGSNYIRESTGLLRWLVLSTLPFMLNSWYLSYSLVVARIKTIVFAQGLQLVFTLAASNLLIPVYGVTGVGIAWFLAQSIITIFALIKLAQVLSGKDANVLDTIARLGS
jgi:O-antigen/teichoic acid export membrane protein